MQSSFNKKPNLQIFFIKAALQLAENIPDEQRIDPRPSTSLKSGSLFLVMVSVRPYIRTYGRTKQNKPIKELNHFSSWCLGVGHCTTQVLYQVLILWLWANELFLLLYFKWWCKLSGIPFDWIYETYDITRCVKQGCREILHIFLHIMYYFVLFGSPADAGGNWPCCWPVQVDFTGSMFFILLNSPPSSLLGNATYHL